jgi:hypothetical protein
LLFYLFLNMLCNKILFLVDINLLKIYHMGIGDWGLGIGDWGFGGWGPTPNPQTPNPQPQTPNPKKKIFKK